MVQRNRLFDVLKGFLSYMVVWWHCTTAIWGGHETYYFAAKIVTITFGMPLFMAISGYFLYYSCSGQKKTGTLIFNKVKRVLIPCLFWESLLSLRGDLSYGSTWYLWSYFVLSILVILVIRIFRKNTLCHTVLFFIAIILLFVPSNQWYLSWMYPFLILGYLFNEYNLEKAIGIRKTVVAFFAFACMLLFWKKEYIAYLSGTSILLGTDIEIILFRFVIGSFGCFFVYSIMKLLLDHNKLHGVDNFLARAGKYSFEIYIFHTTVIMKILTKVLVTYGWLGEQIGMSEWVCQWLIGPATAVVVVELCLLAVHITGRTKWVKRILWGTGYSHE